MAQVWQAIASGACVSLIGERRVGKSSILNALRFEFAPDLYSGSADLSFIFLESQYFKDCTEAKFLEYFLEQIQAETGAGEAPPERESLRRVVLDLRRSSPSRRLVVLWDEIDALSSNKNISTAFYSYLRAWTQDFQISLVIASKEGSIDTLMWNDVGSPFWNIFRPLYVGPFQEEEADKLIRTPAENMDLPFTEEEVQRILMLGGYHPFFLQIACDHMFQLRSGVRGKEREFEAVEYEFRFEAMPHLKYLIDGLPLPERKALVEFILNERLPEGKTLSELIRKGVVIQHNGKPRPFSVLMADYLGSDELLEVSEVSEASLLEKVKVTFDRVRAKFLE